MIKAIPYTKVALLSLAGATLVFSLAFGSYQKLDGMSHLQTIWYFLIITGYLAAVFSTEKSKYKLQIATGLYCLNLLLQLYLFNRFLQDDWVG